MGRRRQPVIDDGVLRKARKYCDENNIPLSEFINDSVYSAIDPIIQKPIIKEVVRVRTVFVETNTTDNDLKKIETLNLKKIEGYVQIERNGDKSCVRWYFSGLHLLRGYSNAVGIDLANTVFAIFCSATQANGFQESVCDVFSTGGKIEFIQERVAESIYCVASEVLSHLSLVQDKCSQVAIKAYGRNITDEEGKLGRCALCDYYAMTNSGPDEDILAGFSEAERRVVYMLGSFVRMPPSCLPKKNKLETNAMAALMIANDDMLTRLELCRIGLSMDVKQFKTSGGK